MVMASRNVFCGRRNSVLTKGSNLFFYAHREVGTCHCRGITARGVGDIYFGRKEIDECVRPWTVWCNPASVRVRPGVTPGAGR